MPYTDKDRIVVLMKNWTTENKQKLYDKMQKKGIDGGGILSTTEENLALFNYLMTDVVGIK